MSTYIDHTQDAKRIVEVRDELVRVGIKEDIAHEISAYSINSKFAMTDALMQVNKDFADRIGAPILKAISDLSEKVSNTEQRMTQQMGELKAELKGDMKNTFIATITVVIAIVGGSSLFQYSEMRDINKYNLGTREKLITVSEDVSELKTGFKRLESKMDKLEPKMDKLEPKMDKLESKMDKLESKIVAKKQ